MRTYTKLTKSSIKGALRFGELLKFTSNDWAKLGRFAIKLIREDLSRGILQGLLRKDTYRSAQYKKYKSNEMRRFTRDTAKGSKKAKIKGISKIGGNDVRKTDINYVTGGKRLKEYYGKKITSTETQNVNMTLTGELTNGLHVSQANNLSCEISAAARDAMKIQGNRDRGREILTLRVKNQKQVQEYMFNRLNKNMRNWARQNITIKVGA